MGYKQWGAAHLVNKTKSVTVSVKNAQKQWGKWYQGPNQDVELSDDDINKIQIGPGKDATIWACGRENASSGCEVQVDLYEGNTKMCTVYWMNPWGAASNVVEVRDRGEDYPVVSDPYNRDNGSLGQFDIKIYKNA